MAKHVEGRQSMHDLDYIFNDSKLNPGEESKVDVNSSNFLE
jgi:hypothetical protein